MNEKEIFQAAVEISDPAKRQAYLAQACGGDATLRARIEALLAAHAAASSEFLNVPVMEQVQPPTVSADQPTAEFAATTEAGSPPGRRG
jgi:eukaryotic-like serine/threonine-protein kinase